MVQTTRQMYECRYVDTCVDVQTSYIRTRWM